MTLVNTIVIFEMVLYWHYNHVCSLNFCLEWLGSCVLTENMYFSDNYQNEMALITVNHWIFCSWM